MIITLGKSKFFLSLVIIILLGTFLVFLSIINRITFKRIDMPTVNTILQTAIGNWNDLNSASFPQSPYSFHIIDITGAQLYPIALSSDIPFDQQLLNAASNMDIILDINIDNKLYGKLIIENKLPAEIEKTKLDFLTATALLFAILIVIFIVYLIYLKRKLYKPFDKLSVFAKTIASGNLDIPLPMDRGNMLGPFSESFDLMREQLKTAQQNEYKANISKKELIASLSHDIKTPLASIQAVCEVTRLNGNDEDIDAISNKAQQIDQLVCNLFSSTMEELTELRTECNTYDSHIIHDIIIGADGLNRVQFVNTIQPCLISCDRLRLSQVIANILSNAEKYAKTAVEVSCKVIYDEHVPCFLQVSFKDFGTGVLENELPLITQKYFRGSQPKDKSGSGLGLYISKALMEKQNGFIEFGNSPFGLTVIIGISIA